MCLKILEKKDKGKDEEHNGQRLQTIQKIELLTILQVRCDTRLEWGPFYNTYNRYLSKRRFIECCPMPEFPEQSNRYQPVEVRLRPTFLRRSTLGAEPEYCTSCTLPWLFSVLISSVVRRMLQSPSKHIDRLGLEVVGRVTEIIDRAYIIVLVVVVSNGHQVRPQFT